MFSVVQIFVDERSDAYPVVAGRLFPVDLEDEC
jgi:hypothetical protein